MKWSTELFCPECGSRVSLKSFVRHYTCPQCNQECFLPWSYGNKILLAVILALTVLVVSCQYELPLWIVAGLTLSVAVAGYWWASRKNQLKNKAEHLAEGRRLEAVGAVWVQAISIGGTIYLFSMFATLFKDFYPNYLLAPYPSFTKVTLGLIPAKGTMTWLIPMIVAGVFLLCNLLQLKRTSTRKILSWRCRLTNKTAAIFSLLFFGVMLGLFLPLAPLWLGSTGQAGDRLIDTINILAWLGLVTVPAGWYAIGMTRNHSLSALRRRMKIGLVLTPLAFTLIVTLTTMAILDLILFALANGDQLGLIIILNSPVWIIMFVSVGIVIFTWFVPIRRRKYRLYRLIDFHSRLMISSTFLSMYITTVLLFMIFATLRNANSWQGNYDSVTLNEPVKFLVSQKNNLIIAAIAIIIVSVFFFLRRKQHEQQNYLLVWCYALILLIFVYYPYNSRISPPIFRAGLIDRQGSWVVKPVFLKLSELKNGLCVATGKRYEFHKKEGIINRFGEWQVKPQYDYIYPFANATFRICTSNDFAHASGIIDGFGKVIVAPVWTAIGSLSEGRIAVRGNDGKWGYLDVNRKMIIPRQYTDAGIFSEGLAAVKDKNKKYGFINKFGQWVIQPKFTLAFAFKSCIAHVEIDQHVFFIDKQGKEIAKPENVDDDDFHDGLKMIKRNMKYGFIDRSGKEVIPLSYDNAEEFSDGLAAVMLNGRWGYIDHRGKMVIPPKFIRAGKFSEGLASVVVQTE